MAKKHILTVGLYDFAFDSITAATNVLKILEKAIPCDWTSNPDGKSYYEEDTSENRRESRLELNQDFRPKRPVKAVKPLALPAPKRGTILCICEKSYVAPREICPHCGRAFTESHSRTHKSTAIEKAEQPRLL